MARPRCDTPLVLLGTTTLSYMLLQFSCRCFYLHFVITKIWQMLPKNSNNFGLIQWFNFFLGENSALGNQKKGGELPRAKRSFFLIGKFTKFIIFFIQRPSQQFAIRRHLPSSLSPKYKALPKFIVSHVQKVVFYWKSCAKVVFFS
jgi:hypothetical protein